MRYKASNVLGGSEQNLSTAYKTLVSLRAATANTVVRGILFDVLFSVDTAPADNTIIVDVSRMTATGTATGITANPNDPADAASRSKAEANYTAEPTVTSNSGLLSGLAINQRGWARWTVDPAFGLFWPATDQSGLVMRGKSPAYTSTMLAEGYFAE